MILAAALSLALYTEVSNSDESMDDFASRISTEAVVVTGEHRVSICGFIGEADGRYRIRLSTDKTWKRCDIDLSETIKNFPRLA